MRQRMGLDNRSHTYRRIKVLLFITTIAYILLGVAAVWQAYAQESYVSYTPITRVPSGSDDKSVKAYYEYLAQTDFTGKKETYNMNPASLTWTYGSLGFTIILFYYFIYAWFARRVSGDLYPVEVYNGYISERGAPVDAFNIAAFAVLGAYMAYYMVITIIFGQIY
ncbi:MAG: hypothetical protein ACYC56_11130 [Candidatus Aquicultor sp.]